MVFAIFTFGHEKLSSKLTNKTMKLRNKKVLDIGGASRSSSASCPSGLAGVVLQPKPGQAIEANRATVVRMKPEETKSFDKNIGNNNIEIKECKVVLERINTTALTNNTKKVVEVDVKECRVVVNKLTECDLKKFQNLDSKVTNTFESLSSQCGDGSKSKILKCNSKFGCGTCPVLETSDYCVSNVTHRLIKCTNNDLPFVVNCKSANLVYLLSCKKCNMQYVGETARNLYIRIREHRFSATGKHGDKACKYIEEHFSKGICKDAGFHVNIIEKLEGNGRTDKGAIDLSVAKFRRSRETKYITELRTIYPYGLNVHSDDKHKADKMNHIGQDVPIGIVFPKLPKSAKYLPKTGISHTKHSNKRLSHNDRTSFIDELISMLNSNLSEVTNYIRVKIFSMKKKDLKHVGGLIQDKLCEDEFPQFNQWFEIAMDIIMSRLFKNNKPANVKKRKTPKHRITVPFTSKALDFINFPQILRSEKVIKALPKTMSADDSPMVVYSMTQPIRSKVLNYNKFVTELDLKAFSKDRNIVSCHCKDYKEKYVDKDHGHILTGNLSIVENEDLRKLLYKGPNYRQPREINFVEGKEVILKSVDSFIKSVKDKKGVQLHHKQFDNWKHTILEEVQSKIDHILTKFTVNRVRPVLSDPTVKKELEKLQDHFVIVTIDKASNNIALVCKQLYASVIHDEIKFTDDTSPDNTYEKVNKTPRNILDSHKKHLKKLGIELEETCEKLPNMYWMPKMHKSPVGKRFIIASKQSSLKSLSQNITSALQIIFRSIKSFYEKRQTFTFKKSFWVSQSNQDVIERLEKMNMRSSAKSVSTFDFSTLYTMIPHIELLQVMEKLFAFTFDSSSRKFINVGTNESHWSSKPGSWHFTKDTLTSSLKYIIDNSFFQVGSLLFRQRIGIPMGSSPAPFLANLFLFHYEKEWVEKSDRKQTRYFDYTFRFIDDLITLNDGNQFENIHKEIYPKQLTLKKENKDNNHATFLDLEIEIIDGKFDYKLYDKRNSYDFHIVRFPYRKSNIPSKVFYGAIGAEILRIARATLKYDHFIQSVQPFISRMKTQGSVTDKVIKVFSKVINTNQVQFEKYGKNSRQIINAVFN